MKVVREFVVSTVVGGLFIVVPVYLAVLLLLKGMKSVTGLVRPFAALLPDWIPLKMSSPCCSCSACASSSAWPCGRGQGRRPGNPWRSCSSSDSRVTGCCAA